MFQNILFISYYRYAGEIKHGKLSPIRHDGRGLFNGLPQGFQSTRYHSLSASVKTLPDVLAITAVTEESGVIMGIRHRKYTLESVQYHPESVLSQAGDDLLRNFLSLKGGCWEENPAARVLDLALPPFPIDMPNGKAVTPKTSKLPTILEKIHTQRLKDIEQAKSTPGTTPEDISTLLSMNLSPPLVNVVERLQTTPDTAPALMAEIKRASPSKGPIAMKTNAAQQALTYALSGASVISVLTEPTWFKGSLLDMRLVRQAIDTLPNRPAVLRKDFIVDEYQISEARLHGADTVLLIVAMLPINRLHSLYAYSKSLGMEPLVEVNNAAEMESALALGAKIIGVNNRNLHNFEVDMGTTSRLADMVRERDVILCALSGISSAEDVKTYVDQGVRAVLVGEALMRAKDPSAFITQLLGWTKPEETEEVDEAAPLVKICGIRTVEEAKAAYDAGADMLGLMFVPASKRHVSLDVACQISYAIRELRAQHESTHLTSSAQSTEDVLQQARNETWFSVHAHRLSKKLSKGHARPLLVGVFQNQPLDYILDAVAAAQLDIVQLHGEEPFNWALHIPVPVIRSSHVGKPRGLDGISRPGLHQFILLDSVREVDGLSGGSGKMVDLELAKKVIDDGENLESRGVASNAETNGVNGHSGESQSIPKRHTRLPVILAGGLSPENVAGVVLLVRPWAVDVSSGVENGDGSGKDVEKIITFVRRAKGIAEPTVVPIEPQSIIDHETTPSLPESVAAPVIPMDDST